MQETALKLQQTIGQLRCPNPGDQRKKAAGLPSLVMNCSRNKGVKVSRIVSLSDDIKLNLAVADIRIEAPIPGKAAVGIGVPNKENSTVALRDLLEVANLPSTLRGLHLLQAGISPDRSSLRTLPRCPTCS